MGDLRDRTREFSLRVIRLVAALPETRIAWRLGDQLLRAGTSAEYVAKLNSGLMELEEAVYWMELLAHSEIVQQKRLAPLAQEADELTAIFVSLIKKEKGGR